MRVLFDGFAAGAGNVIDFLLTFLGRLDVLLQGDEPVLVLMTRGVEAEQFSEGLLVGEVRVAELETL